MRGSIASTTAGSFLNLTSHPSPPSAVSKVNKSLDSRLTSHDREMANIKAPGAPEPGTFLFTSESVNEGHPDKICDQVSDAVLDACLREDPASRVACETCTKTGMVMIFGEISTNANVNYEQVIRDAIKDIGYDDTAKGLDYKTCSVVVAVEEQSPDIAQSVDSQRIEDLGAGDQGIMFGYATDESESLMPLSHVLATQIGARLTEVRKKGICEWCRPDGKTQVWLRSCFRFDPVCTSILLIVGRESTIIKPKSEML